MPNILKNKLVHFKENVSLAPFTTFKIGGPARYFYIAKNSKEIAEVVRYAESESLKYFILANGSNLLVSDKGFDGLVIKIENTECFHEGGGVFYCGAGLVVSRLIQLAKKSGYGGIEFMSGIPGTVGGATRGNSGAWGKGFGDVIKEVEIYKEGKILNLSKEKMGFSYRESVVKKQGGIILSIKIQLTPRYKKEIEQDIKEILKKREIQLRVEGTSAGCVFKNIDLRKISVDREKIKKALDLNEDEYINATKHEKLPVGIIIDRLGLKGKTIGKAMVSNYHAGYIVNLGKAKAEDVIMLISFIKVRVRNTLGIQLHEEIGLVGF